MSIWALLAAGIGLAVVAIVLAPIAAGWITMNRKSAARRGDEELH
jgi:hypothetical protein